MENENSFVMHNSGEDLTKANREFHLAAVQSGIKYLVTQLLRFLVILQSSYVCWSSRATDICLALHLE